MTDWKQDPWKGVFAATLCTFHDDETIDEDGLRAYIAELCAVDGPSVARQVLFKGLVVEQIELDELHALVFEVDQRTVDAALVAIENVRAHIAPLGFGFEVTRRPIIRPVDPGRIPLRSRLLAAPTQGVRLADLA